MIANKKEEIENSLSLRVVRDEYQRKSKETTIWKHNHKLFLIVCRYVLTNSNENHSD